jgi:ribonuclease Y
MNRMSSVILFSSVAAIIGLIVGYAVRQLLGTGKINSAESKAEKILAEAMAKAKEEELSAKQRSLAIIEEAKQDEAERRRELKEEQARVTKREALLDEQLSTITSKEKTLTEKSTELDKLKAKYEEAYTSAVSKLEEVAGMNQDEAKEKLLNAVEERAKEDVLARIRKVQDEGDIEVEEKAKQILGHVIQRAAISHASETMTTTVDLPSDDMKGRIIGKEGRNIKTLEQLTGVEIIVDDTPGSIMISGFNLVRRHLAKKALENMMLDGRIHPTKIEEAVDKAKRELAIEMKKAGEEALLQLGIAAVDPKLVQILGRLKFRTSFGQNVLQHSIEVGTVAGLLADELGADVAFCKKGGLFHDIGKAIDHEIQGPHTELGYRLMKKYGFTEEMSYMAIAHHEDRPATLEGAIIAAADAVSASRPGARRDSVERYIQRLDELEKAATSLPGVTKAYAIQAGREVRVFVTPTEIDDLGMVKLAQSIARKIESELQYPGEVKVHCIRESRVVEYAR